MIDTGSSGARPRAETVAGILIEAEQRSPDAIALIHGERRITYHELRDAVLRFASCLARAGVVKGDAVVLLIGNAPAFPVAHYALATLGAVVVPVNLHLRGKQLAYVLGHCDAKVVITSPSLAEAVRSLDDPPTSMRTLMVLEGSGSQGAPWLVGIEALPAPGLPETTALLSHDRHGGDRLPAPDDDAIIFFTSGTTGRPKGILVTHRQALVAIDCWADRWQFGPATVSLMVAPFFHVVYNPLVLGAHRHGGAAVALERLSARAAMSEVDRTRATALMGNPAVFMQLLEDPHRSHHDLSSIDTLIYGAAPMPVPVIRELRRSFPAARCYNCYGLSETCSAISCLGPEDTDLKPDSIGRPHPPVQVAILDEAGEPVPQGAVGEISCRGPNVMKGYCGSPEETRKRFLKGWLLTGDLGYLDRDGYLYILDRVDDLIIIAGEKVYPREVEEALFEHPDVIDAAVVGREHPVKGHSVKAFVVLRSGAALREADLRHFCAERLPPAGVPRQFEFVEAVPRNPAGKVLRAALP